MLRSGSRDPMRRQSRNSFSRVREISPMVVLQCFTGMKPDLTCTCMVVFDVVKKTLDGDMFLNVPRRT